MYNKKIALFVGAHYDDIELGCAGTILKLKKKKYKIIVIIISDSVIINHSGKIIRSEKNIKKESRKAFKMLGVDNHICLNLKTNDLLFDNYSKKTFIKFVEYYKPSILFTHHPFDLHQDHQATGKMSLNFSRKIPNIFFYRSNFYKNIKFFNKNFYVNISKEFPKKIKIISCYEKELFRVKNSWKKFVKIENKENGMVINEDYAEAFEVFKFKSAW